MAGDGWAPIEPTTHGSGEPARPGPSDGRVGAQGGAHAATGRVRTGPGRRGGVLVAVLVVAAVVAVVAGVVVGGLGDDLAGDDGADDPAAADGAGAGADVAGTEAPPRPAQAWAEATVRLAEAGTFGYRGTVRSDGATAARPGIWRAGELEVEGEVELPALAHEVAVDAGGQAVETVAEHVVVWGREAASREDLASRPLDVVAEYGGGLEAGPYGAALVATWLTAAGDRHADGTDPDGRQRYRGTLTSLAGPLADDGDDSPVADIVLVVDDAGIPARVEVTTLPGRPLLEVALDISDVGEPLSVDLPTGHAGSVHGDVGIAAAQAAGISNAVELGALPDGWVLYDVELLADEPGPGCWTLRLWYGEVPLFESAGSMLVLDVRASACPLALEITGDPITLGPFSGTVSAEDGSLTTEVADAQTTLVISTDMPLADLVALGAAIEPFDPATPPRLAGAPG